MKDDVKIQSATLLLQHFFIKKKKARICFDFAIPESKSSSKAVEAERKTRFFYEENITQTVIF